MIIAPDFARRRWNGLREARNTESIHRLNYDCGQSGTCPVITVGGWSVRQLARGRRRVHAPSMLGVEQHRGLREDFRMLQQPRATLRAIVMMPIGPQEDDGSPALFFGDFGKIFGHPDHS